MPVFQFLGDPQYQSEESEAFSKENELFSQELCAKRLEFRHPMTGEKITIYSRQNVWKSREIKFHGLFLIFRGIVPLILAEDQHRISNIDVVEYCLHGGFRRVYAAVGAAVHIVVRAVVFTPGGVVESVWP